MRLHHWERAPPETIMQISRPLLICAAFVLAAPASAQRDDLALGVNGGAVLENRLHRQWRVLHRAKHNAISYPKAPSVQR